MKEKEEAGGFISSYLLYAAAIQTEMAAWHTTMHKL